MTCPDSVKHWTQIASGTMTYLESEILRAWSWQPQDSKLPPIHVAPAPPIVVSPHIPKRYNKTFMRHRFKIGGSKK